MMLFSYLPKSKTSKLGRPRNPGQYICRVRCDKCLSEFDIKYSQLFIKKYPDLCKPCAISATMLAREYKPLSDSQKEKIKASFTAEVKQHLSKLSSGKNNPNYGGTWRGGMENHNAHLALWKGKTHAEIFGVEKAARISKQLSLKSKGCNNAMYGKPAPKGSGSGWSGWLDGIYFRSLLELSFMLDNPTAASAESISIQYTKNGVDRTYRPDFMLGDKIIELKPLALISTAENILKFEAARAIYGDKFSVLTEANINKVSISELTALVNSGRVKLTPKYEQKLNAYKPPD